MRIDIVSLFPDYFRGPFDESIVGRARHRGILDLHLIDLREFGEGSHRQVDDRAYGGGPGMVLMPGPVTKALQTARQRSSQETKKRTIFLSPQGKPLTAAKCRELAQFEHLILLCGHYEGVDQRVVDTQVDEEISIGDYVLTNGCLPAIVLVDATIRFIPGVIGHSEASEQDSFEEEILDCPHYTRPEKYAGHCVPQVLLEGNHTAIALWRKQQAVEKTRRMRPDLYVHYASRQRKLLRESSVKPKRDCFGFNEKGITTLTLRVQQLRRSRRFYREVLGLHLLEESSEQLCFCLGQQRLLLGIGKTSEDTASLVLERIVEDPALIEQMIDRLVHIPDGGVISQERNSSLTPVLWLRDPDGYEWRVRLEASDNSK